MKASELARKVAQPRRRTIRSVVGRCRAKSRCARAPWPLGGPLLLVSRRGTRTCDAMYFSLTHATAHEHPAPQLPDETHSSRQSAPASNRRQLDERHGQTTRHPALTHYPRLGPFSYHRRPPVAAAHTRRPRGRRASPAPPQIEMSKFILGCQRQKGGSCPLESAMRPSLANMMCAELSPSV